MPTNIVSPEYIKKLRKTYGYTQEVFSEWLEISRPSYAKRENGTVEFSVNEFITILKIIKRFHPDFNSPVDIEALSINKVDMNTLSLKLFLSKEELANFNQSCNNLRLNPVNLIRKALDRAGFI